MTQIVMASINGDTLLKFLRTSESPSDRDAPPVSELLKLHGKVTRFRLKFDRVALSSP